MKNFFMYLSGIQVIILIVVIIVYSIAVMDLTGRLEKSDRSLGGLTNKVVGFSGFIYTYVWMPIVGALGTGIYLAKKKFLKKKKPETESAG